MALTSILVALRLGQDNAPVLTLAASLAARFGAYVEGIALCQPLPVTGAPIYLASEALTADHDRRDADIAAAEAAFRAAMRGQATATDWYAAMTEESVAVALSAHARATDLIMVAAERHGADENADSLRLGDLIAMAGRPILIVPPQGAKISFDHALIAWKDGAAARRAITDSLPLLHKTRRISLVEIAPDQESDAARTRLALLAGWLARHKIKAEPRVFTTVGEDAERLHLLAREEKADLVVAGGYAHHRMREWIFGGVTRTLLSQDERCILLSH